MTLKPLPLALALALSMGVLAAGCTRDGQSAADETAAATAAADHAATEAAAAAGADAHAGDEHAAEVAGAAGADFPVPANHVRWTPDAPLEEGMSRVRSALAGLEAESHPDDAAVAKHAADIDAAVAYMFANCKLEPEPDVALHAILARLMAGTRALAENPSDSSPVADMHAAMHNYEQLFDDPSAAS